MKFFSYRFGGNSHPACAQIARNVPVGITHTGWERLGDKAQETRDSYDNGWVYVLACYAMQS